MPFEDRRSKNSDSLDARLELLAKQLMTRAQLERWSTQDQFWNGVNETLWQFYTYLRTTYSEAVMFEYKERLDPDKMVELLKAAVFDIEGGYARVGESQSEFLRRVNRFNSTFSSVQTRVSKANNLVAGISTETEDDIFEFGDSFNETTLIAEGQDKDDPMSVFTAGGLATLPRSSSADIKIASVRLLPASNGDENQDEERQIDKLFDENPDTWFEYFRLVGEDDTDALQLEMLVTLQQVAVVNLVQIDALVRDDKAFPKVIDISTSLDGRNFRSIREGLPGNLTKDEEEELFTLGSVGLRNQETAEYLFTPRICQFVKVQLRQGKKVDVEGEDQQRIALREIRFRSQSFADQGTLTTTTFQLPWFPRRLFLEQRVNDVDPLILLQWQVSVDGGTEWFDISPEETLEINTGASGAVTPGAENGTVTLRVTAQRVKENFTGVSRPLAENIRTIIQRVQVAALPIDIGLRNLPISDSLDVFRPIFAIGQTYGFELPTLGTGKNNLTLDLPAAIDPFSETVKVNGYPWTRVKNFRESQPDDYHYTIDYVEKKIQFGESKTGQFPEGVITLELDAERVLLPDTSPFIAELDYHHDFNNENTKVTWYDRPRRTDAEGLSRGRNTNQLENFPVLPHLVVDEDVPTNSTDFWLANIPVSGLNLVFSDKTTFATEVSGTPAADGEYRVEQLSTNQRMNPVHVTVYGRTPGLDAGTITVESRGKILVPQTGYTQDSWNFTLNSSGLTNIVDIYEPVFSDRAIFARSQTFVNGRDELNTEGDYSIDYENGVVYSAAETRQAGASSVTYNYQENRELAWEFNDESNQLVINDDSFLVNKNDDNPIILRRTNKSVYVVFKDNRYVDIPVDFVGQQTNARRRGVEIDYQDNGVIIDFDRDDFIRGKALTEGAQRVRLPHQGIVKNSMRFTFLSDNINSYNDRIVTVETDGSVTVSPKPIRDVYGNRLNGIQLSEQTQRDIDAESLTRERNFVDGETELERGGDYSVDYANGVLYTFTPIPAHTIVQYEYTDVRVSYVGTLKLNQTQTGGRVQDFTFNVDELSVNVQSIQGQALEGGELLVKYDIIDQLKDDPATIFTYYSPVLMGYVVKARRK